MPILNVPDVLQSATKISGYPVKISVREGVGKEEKEVHPCRGGFYYFRMLLKNILETAGYQVKVAVDGMDAFTALRTEDVDLVVSDVDMPRMNGFDLTTKIQGDTKLAEMPVVLVTALDSREDRERGIDVGANAYIVKSSFDQSNLLEVVKRLI
ncbi:MAG: response regulator [Candidatus Brocadiaceae bacterium]